MRGEKVGANTTRGKLSQVQLSRSSIQLAEVEEAASVRCDVEKRKGDLFRLRGCEKIDEKYIFLLYFSTIFPKINFIFGEMSNEEIMSF